MRRRPKWSHVTIALGLIAAVAIASPAIGISGSLKRAIKKEVSKQVSKATGPAGPSGAQGAQGQPAPPTERTESGAFGPTPTVQGLDLLVFDGHFGATITNLTGGVNGQVVTVLNTDPADNVTFNDSGSFQLGANRVVGSGDTLTVIDHLGVWYEMSFANN